MTITRLRRIFRPTPPSAELAEDPPARTSTTLLTKSDRENLDHVVALHRVNLAEHNAGGRPQILAASCRMRRAPHRSAHPDYHGLADVLGEPDVSRRYTPQRLGVGVHPAGRPAERRSPAGRRAVGFGGRRPATALRASTGCAARRLSDKEPAELVRTRRVDMNAVPDDLGPCDLIWSSPRAGTPRQS